MLSAQSSSGFFLAQSLTFRIFNVCKCDAPRNLPCPLLSLSVSPSPLSGLHSASSPFYILNSPCECVQ